MELKKVSLIIPIYNLEKYLHRNLESALSQTYRKMEFICIDDGSTDGSARILDEYARKDERIIAIHQENKGESAARNTGLRLASGDYIGFLDCDDWIDSEMYSELVKALEKEDADMAVSGWIKETDIESTEIKNEKQIKTATFGRQELLKYIYERDSYRQFAYMWNKLYKRSLIFHKPGGNISFDENLILGGDVLFLGELALRVRKAVYIDRSFYHYYQRTDSTSHMADIEKKKDWIRAYQILIKLFESHKISEEIMDLVKRFLVYHSSNLAEIAYEQKNREELLYCQDIMRQYEKVYKKLNLCKPDYINRFERILVYKVI